MMKNRIVVKEKSTNKNRTFVLFSCVNLYTFKNLFDIIGTVTRTNSKDVYKRQTFGYHGNNLLCSNWNAEDMQGLDYNGLYEY